MNFNSSLFNENTAKLGLSFADETISKLDAFAGMLIETNKHMNLTAITSPEDIAVKHFADSLSPLAFVNMNDGDRVIDVGTGAGFPGVPLLIANPAINLTLLDSTAKKLDFIASSLSALGLSAETLHMRAEDAGHKDDMRGSFDYVFSRAVAPLNILCEYCLPFVRPGGKFIAMKGSKADEEIKDAYVALKTLGGAVSAKHNFELTDGERCIIIIDKLSETPKKYPRASAQISRKPL